MSAPIHEYAEMMACTVRMRAYQEAIQATCPGRVVCEIGVGLGPLSLMALQAGAARVYGIEVRADSLALATTVIRANGFGPDRFVPLQGLSTRVDLPERVDVILSETLDSMGTGENTLRYMLDAQTRLLRPGGRMVPQALRCVAAACHASAWTEREDLWVRRLPSQFGVDYGAVTEELRQRHYVLDVHSDELRSDWLPWLQVQFGGALVASPERPILLPILKPGWVNAIAFAFDAHLAADVHIRTTSSDPTTCWHQGVFPMLRPVQAAVGDLIYGRLRVADSERPDVPTRIDVAHISAARRNAFLARLRAELGQG